MDNWKGIIVLVLINYVDVSYPFEQPPNIVMVVADDMGWDDIGYHGSDQISTPNLDRLANEGVKLENYYTQPLCSPSRSAIMTGRYPIHTGMQHMVIDTGEPWGVGLNETFLPHYLKKQGYSTHAIGKWHLGYYRKGHIPTNRGFDSFYGYYLPQSDYFNHTMIYKGQIGLDLHEEWKGKEKPDWSKQGTYNTELFTAKTEERIAAHNASDPLFIYLAYESPHTGWRRFKPLNDRIQVPKEWLEQFPNITNLGRRKYVANIAYMDYGVGRVYEALRAKEILNNTIFIFISDNGGEPNGFRGNWGSNYPLRGAKFGLFEGGVKVPAFVNSKLLQSTSGQSLNELFHVTDWLPTLIKLAGGTPPADILDGVDQWNTITQGSLSKRKEVLLNIDLQYRQWGLRIGHWKIVKQGKLRRFSQDGWCCPPNYQVSTRVYWYPDCLTVSNVTQCVDEFCLFDMSNDAEERRDLSKQHPDILDKMLQRLSEYETTMVPARNIRIKDPRASPKFHNGVFEPWAKEY